MAKYRRTNKSDSRQASLFFEEDDDVQEVATEEAEAMPDIEVILPEKKVAEPGKESAEESGPTVHRRKLRFMSFGSGSSGNCAYFGNDDGGVLIDAGVDIKFVFESLRKNGITSDKVKGILLTHDHGDHVRYAYNIVRRNSHIRLYCTPRLMNGLLRRHSVSRRIKDYQENVFKEIPFKIADFTITAFDTSHDGTDNMGFMIETDGQKFVVAPDMGVINARTAFYCKEANYLMLESNYDSRMLDEGSYPEYLKQRIRKETGHLDNKAAARFVAENYSEKLKYLFLCHLSNDNNTPEIALATMRAALEARGVTVGDCSNSLEMRDCALQLFALPRYDCSPLFVLTD
ncbi:MAG: MBL fold metallo-hydrolase [Muribaculaceae bacterium]